MEQLSCWQRNGASPEYCHRLGSAALSRLSTYISEFMFPIKGTNGHKPNHKKHPHTIMLPPPKLTVGTMQSLKKRSSGIRQTQTRPDCKARFIIPKNSFPHVHSPMTVSSTPLQSMLRILWSDVWLVSGCKTMESQVFKHSMDSPAANTNF
ncbi:hypothetical protein TNCV_414941 [Trichonephila clavipes]|nr:hypothetical protein TNCV_414941 [Trichonephila clavipes]